MTTQPLADDCGRADLYWLSGTHRRALLLAAATSRAAAPEVLDRVITELGVAEARTLTWGASGIGRISSAAQFEPGTLPVRFYLDEVAAMLSLQLAPGVRARLARCPAGGALDLTPAPS